MKIVYVTDSAINPESGGIARITYVMSEALRKIYGYSVYSYFGQEDFRTFIQKIGSCIVIIQSPGKLALKLLKTIGELENVKVINVFHGTPGYELVPLEQEIIYYRLLHNIERKWTIKQLLLQVGMRIFPRHYFIRMLRKKYALPYGKVDKMVVLSHSIINQYQIYAHGYRDLFRAIPNAISFESISVPYTKYANKEVLVVARLDDWHKRILEVLKIWELFLSNCSFADWTLRIVGDGIDKPFYEEYIHKHNILNVCFEGQQNPLIYYQNASIFIMTSACEGLPMTILEAQQCGCVPIVYDSFASTKDVIRNGVNGFLVADGDRQRFVAVLEQLMSDSDLRKKMSAKCMELSANYSIDKIASQWNDLLQLL